MTANDMRLVLLGTAGGPLPSVARSGIAQAVVVGDRVHVIDCGNDVTRQLRRAKLLSRLRQVFLTHLHSDHVCDYFNLFLLGWPILQHNPPVQVFGPGSAGPMCALPAEGDEPAIPLVSAANPTPGIVDITRHHVAASAFDLNIRMREAGRSDLTELIQPFEIAVPDSAGATPLGPVSPPMAPIVVTEDDDVRVTAILVEHAPVFPAFAYRFDTARGSIVFSGDTAPCPNLVSLAQGADILVHEVYDDARIGEVVAIDTWEARRRLHHMVTSHTPLSEVGKVAADAGVGRLVLTHFVPGDDVLPDEHWIAGVTSFGGEVTVGHDLLELSL
ncbi:MAG TPA: MBL fold metallo-hydrolase [Acidimicrobiales bacterium]|nr:MBL fold metallo-hydrolase [Acidimicrobiales bacterium]